MRLQEKIRGQRIARQRGSRGGGWIGHLVRRGEKVEDELPVPQQSGFVRMDEVQPVFEHQKVKADCEGRRSQHERDAIDSSICT